MSTKNKIIISVTTVSLIAVIAVVAIVAVFAATAQSFDTSIKVTYSASAEISGTAKANYYTGNKSSFTTVIMYANGDAESGDELKFQPGDYTNEKTLAPTETNVTLDSEKHRYIVFEYIFTCDDGSYTAKLTYEDSDPTDKNVTISYKDSTDKISAANDFESFDPGTTFPDTKTISTTVTAGQEKYVYIKVTVTKWNENAEFSGKFHWDLSNKTE